MKMNLPNSLTLFRIALIPVFVVVFYLPFNWTYGAAAFVFAFAASTDWLDGYLARRMNQTSAFGAFLDPVADKLMVATALVLLVQQEPTVWLAIPALIIIGREIAISALREWMSALGESASVAVSYIGKIKTFAQMLAIFLMLIHNPVAGFPVLEVGYVLIYAAAVLTLWSMFIYLRAAWPKLLENSDN